MLGFPYEDSERKARELNRTDYAEWVAKAFPWKLWGRRWRDFGGWRFGIVAARIADGDPPRIGRKARQEKYGGHGGMYEEVIYKQRRTGPEAYERAILKHLRDGRPRTLNRIAVETLDLEGNAVPASFLMALQRLLYERKLAFAFVPTKPNDEWPLILFWNDAAWRRNHPEFDAVRRPPYGQLEILAADEVALPAVS